MQRLQVLARVGSAHAATSASHISAISPGGSLAVVGDEFRAAYGDGVQMGDTAYPQIRRRRCAWSG